jgi:hypothetical protein
MRNSEKSSLIARLLSCSREVILAGVARLNVNISPLTILFVEVLFLAITGGTLIILFYPEGMGYIYYDKGYLSISYLSMLYASLVLVQFLMGWACGKFSNYAGIVHPSASILCVLVCYLFCSFWLFIWLFVRLG